MRPSSISYGSPTTEAPKASTYQAMASRAFATDRYGSAAGRGGADATGSAADSFRSAVAGSGPPIANPCGWLGRGTADSKRARGRGADPGAGWDRNRAAS